MPADDEVFLPMSSLPCCAPPPSPWELSRLVMVRSCVLRREGRESTSENDGGWTRSDLVRGQISGQDGGSTRINLKNEAGGQARIHVPPWLQAVIAGLMAEMAVDGGHGGGNHPLRWTSPMSGFMLRRFVELIAGGVKTDKGFKEVHLNQVAKNCSEHFGLSITGTQVYNHLRKWRARWVKISKLRDISGSLWDDTNYVISLEEEHYLGHIKDHPKDVEYLNVPLENYVQMLAIFGSGIATGRYAMTSHQALGVPSMVETSPSFVNLEGCGFEFVVDGNEPGSSATAAAHGEDVGAAAHGKEPCKDASSSTGKRKRASLMSEEEVLVMSNMSDAVREVAIAIKSTGEAHPELYNAVMELPGFTEDDLLIVLDYLNENANRARSHSFVQMSETRRTRWAIHHLSKLNGGVPVPKDGVPQDGV